MWNEGVKSGPGMFVTSTGSYGEAIFSAGNIAVSGEIHIDALACKKRLRFTYVVAQKVRMYICGIVDSNFTQGSSFFPKMASLVELCYSIQTHKCWIDPSILPVCVHA